MIKRRVLVLSLAASFLSTVAASAETIVETIVRQLQSQGFREVTVTRTLLGRARIIAHRGGQSREIVVNPRTGEILRDLWDDDEILDGDDRQSASGSNTGHGSGGNDTSNPGNDGGGDGGNGGGGGDGDGGGGGGDNGDGGDGDGGGGGGDNGDGGDGDGGGDSGDGGGGGGGGDSGDGGDTGGGGGDKSDENDHED